MKACAWLGAAIAVVTMGAVGISASGCDKKDAAPPTPAATASVALVAVPVATAAVAPVAPTTAIAPLDPVAPAKGTVVHTVKQADGGTAVVNAAGQEVLPSLAAQAQAAMAAASAAGLAMPTAMPSVLVLPTAMPPMPTAFPTAFPTLPKADAGK